MNGKAVAVFWIGLFLIIANFWISGQSTVFWDFFTGATPPAPAKKAPPTMNLVPKQPGTRPF